MPPETLFSKIVGIAKQGVPLLALFAVVVLGSLVADYASSVFTASDQDESGLFDGFPACNVAGIELRGCIVTYTPDRAVEGALVDDQCETYTSADDVLGALDVANADDSIEVILLEIDSTGGSAVASEEIAAALRAIQKPTLAWIRGYGDSGAYWIASAADTIVASENSDVGSIGVTSSYIDYARQYQSEGLTYNQLISGKYKDIGTTDRSPTPEERALMQRDLDIMHENFIRAVAAHRQLPLEDVRAFADGSSMLGKMAKEKGLVDILGTRDVVWDELGKTLGDTPHVCW